MDIKSKNSDYFEIQDSRSGGNMNSNTLFKDFELAELSLNKNWNILDIGCRHGAALNRLYQQGFKNVYGIDIGDKARERWIKEKYPFLNNLIQGDIHSGIPFKIKFDLITISHVLEHCYNPALVLEIMFENLNENGYIHSIVPMQSKEDFEKYPPHLVRFETHDEHLNFYLDLGLKKIYDSCSIHGNSVIIVRK